MLDLDARKKFYFFYGGGGGEGGTPWGLEVGTILARPGGGAGFFCDILPLIS